MRVLFLTLYPERAASARYRVHQFLPYLRRAGIEADVACAVSEDVYRRGGKPFATLYHLHEFRRRIPQVLRAGDYDVVVVQKAIMSGYLRGLEGIVRRRARRLVLDMDDAVHLQAPNGLPRFLRPLEDRGQVMRLMALADTVLAGNAWLCDEVRNAGGHPVLFPTVVDTERFCPGEETPAVYRIGWMGGPSTAGSLRLLEGPLASVPYGEICMIGVSPSPIDAPRAVARPWRYEDEVRDLQSFSVGVMPMANEPWWLGKCALKALQYMACGVPCVASPVGAVTEFLDDGVNGVFVTSPDSWRDALERLRDPAPRARLGAAGRATVEARYSLAAAGPRMAELLKSLGAGA